MERFPDWRVSMPAAIPNLISPDTRPIIAFVDAPDPDNFVLLIALARLFPEAPLHVALTGRPVRFNATKETPLWDYDMESSLLAQQSSAARMKNFMRHFGIKLVRVFDGGIAPRTLVPHHIHFSDYYKFLDVDPLAAIRHSELDPQEDLIREILKMDECVVVVGGPMTGLAQLLTRCPVVASKIKEVHAMFATWGTVQLMQMGDQPRGALQFNVACDPTAAYQVLMGLDCPITLLPSEVTRVQEIGFENAVHLRMALPQNAGTRQLFNLYAIWYDAAVKPRQERAPDEKIFIHDIAPAFSLHSVLAPTIYDVVPIEIASVPHLSREAAEWGKIAMRRLEPANESSERKQIHYAATGLTTGGAQQYLSALYHLLE